MAEQVEIYNRALIKLGEDPILAVDQVGKNATTLNRVFPLVRDAALEAYHWKFATARVILAPLVASPTYGWEYAFQKPADFLRVQFVGEDDAEEEEAHIVEGDNILANTDTLYLRYTRKETNVRKYSSLFVEVLSILLAAECAITIADDPALKEQLYKEYKDRLGVARFSDSTQGGSPLVIDATKWLDARN